MLLNKADITHMSSLPVRIPYLDMVKVYGRDCNNVSSLCTDRGKAEIAISCHRIRNGKNTSLLVEIIYNISNICYCVEDKYSQNNDIFI